MVVLGKGKLKADDEGGAWPLYSSLLLLVTSSIESLTEGGGEGNWRGSSGRGGDTFRDWSLSG